MLKKINLLFSLIFACFVSNAAIVYTNPNPDITYNTNGMQNPGIDLDNNGVMDLRFRLDFTATNFYFYHIGGLSPTAGTEAVLDAALGQNQFGAAYWANLPAGTGIGAANNWGNAFPPAIPEPLIGDVGNLNMINSGDCFIGIKFKIGANTHYGWLRLNLTGPVTALIPNIIKDWAYESTPNTTINAGNTGTAANILVTGITVNGQGGATTINTIGGSLQMNAAILPANATNQNVTWSLTNGTGTANINAMGLLTAQTNGTVTVKATAQDGSNVFGTRIITISNQPVPIPVASITVNGQGGIDVINTPGGTLQMSAAILPANATNQGVTWSVQNQTGSAMIDAQGLLAAQNNGTVIVKATAQDGSNVFGTKVVTISNQSTVVLITSITISGENGANEINTPGGMLQMNAVILPANASNQNLEWYVISSGSGAADISSAGLLTAVANGTVTVKAVAKDGSNAFGLATINISNQSTTGITDVTLSDTKIYPNPSSDFLNISLQEKTSISKISIFNIAGQKVYEKAISKAAMVQINISALQQGIYFLQFQTAEGKLFGEKFQKIN